MTEVKFHANTPKLPLRGRFRSDIHTPEAIRRLHSPDPSQNSPNGFKRGGHYGKRRLKSR